MKREKSGEATHNMENQIDLNYSDVDYEEILQRIHEMHGITITKDSLINICYQFVKQKRHEIPITQDDALNATVYTIVDNEIIEDKIIKFRTEASILNDVKYEYFLENIGCWKSKDTLFFDLWSIILHKK